MSFEVDMSGLDRQFRELAYRTESGGKKAAKEASQIVADKLKENTPYDPKTKKHMRDDIVVTKNSELSAQYDVHYGKDTAWRSNWVNDGTIRIKGQHFKEKTIEETKDEARATMQRVINEELNGI